MVLHNIPAALFLCVPFFLYMMDPRTHPWLSVFWAFLKGKNLQSFNFLNHFCTPLLFSSLYDVLEI